MNDHYGGMTADAYSPKVWPPKGHQFAYDVTSDLQVSGGSFKLSFQMTVPKDRTTELATLRVSRMGGTTEADMKFRAELFSVVGSITVAGGHIEAAMKRLLLILSDEDSLFALADHQWSDLHKKLASQCNGGDDRRRKKLKDVLDWAERMNLRERRHTVVHGSWWLYSLEAVLVSRWPRKEDGYILVESLEGLNRLEQQCWEFDQKLDLLADEDWPRAVLPAPPIPPTFLAKD